MFKQSITKIENVPNQILKTKLKHAFTWICSFAKQNISVVTHSYTASCSNFHKAQYRHNLLQVMEPFFTTTTPPPLYLLLTKADDGSGSCWCSLCMVPLYDGLGYKSGFPRLNWAVNFSTPPPDLTHPSSLSLSSFNLPLPSHLFIPLKEQSHEIFGLRLIFIAYWRLLVVLELPHAEWF